MELVEKFEICQDIISLKKLLLKLEKNIFVGSVEEKFVKIVSSKIKELYFNKGDLPDIEVLLVCKGMSSSNVPIEDDFWVKVREYFLSEYNQLDDSRSEKYTYNILIFISELFIKGYDSSIDLFLKRTLVLDTRKADIKNEWVRSFEYFLLHVEPPLDILIEAIKPILLPQNFFSFSKASQRAVFYWCLHVVWTHKPYMNHEKWKTLQEPLKILSDEVLKTGDIATQMYIHFFAYQILGNLFQTQEEWKDFNKDFNQVESNIFKSLHVKPIDNLLKHKKKRIVFVKDRIVENSPYKVEYSLFHSLMNSEEFTSNYDLYVLSLAYIDKASDQIQEVEKLKNLGVQVVSPGQIVHQENEYYDHMKKALIIRDWFIQNEIDIMVGCVNGYDIMNFLFTCRVAPKQIYWSHGDFQYDIEGIDKRVSHFYRENPYEYEKFDVQMLEEFHKPEEEKYKAEAKEIRKKWDKDTVLLGSIGRLVKLDNDEYIETVAKILEENPKSIYLACGTGNEESIKQKLVKYNVAKKRFFFEGFVNAHVYGYIIDVYLNTFPEPSGESANEFLKKGEDKFIVSMEI